MSWFVKEWLFLRRVTGRTVARTNTDSLRASNLSLELHEYLRKEIVRKINAYSRYVSWIYIDISACTEVSVYRKYLNIVNDLQYMFVIIRFDRKTETTLMTQAHFELICSVFNVRTNLFLKERQTTFKQCYYYGCGRGDAARPSRRQPDRLKPSRRSLPWSSRQNPKASQVGVTTLIISVPRQTTQMNPREWQQSPRGRIPSGHARPRICRTLHATPAIDPDIISRNAGALAQVLASWREGDRPRRGGDAEHALAKKLQKEQEMEKKESTLIWWKHGEWSETTCMSRG